MNQHEESPECLKEISFGQSLSIFVVTMSWLLLTILYWHAEPLIPLLTAAVFTGLMLMSFGMTWAQVESALIRGVQSSVMPAILLVLIGILIATWMMSGTVPTLLVYGTSWFQPQWFAFSALVLTCLVSVCVGSSITTVGTFGVALVGMASSMGLNPALVAGAVVSGACFGDKMSPLSDTTNFASAVAKVNMTAHIRNMTWTTVPAFLITSAAFLIFGHTTNQDVMQLTDMKAAMESAYHIHPMALLPLAVVLIAAILRVPIILTMLLGISSGLIVTGLVQTNWSATNWMQVMLHGYQSNITNEAIAAIVNRGGVMSMMWSITLIATAFAFGGLLQHGGVITALFKKIIAPIKRKESMVVSTGLSAIGVNLFTGEQYMSILLPGQMFQAEYERRGIPALTLSRTLEDCGTLVNPLIPWGVSGALMTAALGMSVLEYAPYAFFLLISPLCTFAFALLPGLKTRTLNNSN